jgi:hypothetical protein
MHNAIRAVVAILAAARSGAAFEQVNNTKSERPSKTPPTFEDFRVPTPIQKRRTEAFLSFQSAPDETMDQFQARIRKVAKEGPDFAGHFAVIRAGCGSDWNDVWIVDVQTGAIGDTPFLGATRCVPFRDDPLFSYKMDSTLFIVNGSLLIPDARAKTFDSGPCGKFYYQWDGHALKPISSVVPVKPSSKPSNVQP